MTREAAVSGSFYPEDPSVLSSMIDEFLASKTKVSTKADLRALIVPHAGYIYSGEVAGAGYRLLKDKCEDDEVKVILMGPSHHMGFFGAAVDDSNFWKTPLGEVPVYRPKISSSFIHFDSEVHKKEHCLEVQVPFLQKVLKKFSILPILVGDIDYKVLSGELGKLLVNEKMMQDSFLIVSSDLSHYYPYNVATGMDSIANEAIPKLDIKTVKEKVEACGLTPILTTLQAATKMGWKGKLIEYKNSGDTTGDKGSVVGYGAYAFYRG